MVRLYSLQRLDQILQRVAAPRFPTTIPRLVARIDISTKYSAFFFGTEALERCIGITQILCRGARRRIKAHISFLFVAHLQNLPFVYILSALFSEQVCVICKDCDHHARPASLRSILCWHKDDAPCKVQRQDGSRFPSSLERFAHEVHI